MSQAKVMMDQSPGWEEAQGLWWCCQHSGFPLPPPYTTGSHSSLPLNPALPALAGEKWEDLTWFPLGRGFLKFLFICACVCCMHTAMHEGRHVHLTASVEFSLGRWPSFSPLFEPEALVAGYAQVSGPTVFLRFSWFLSLPSSPPLLLKIVCPSPLYSPGMGHSLECGWLATAIWLTKTFPSWVVHSSSVRGGAWEPLPAPS